MYKKFFRPLLFKFQPEYIHNLTFLFFRFLTFTRLSNLLFKIFINPVKDRELEQELFGIKFRNPVGLAAGLDKNAEVIDVFSDIGFSHIEIGTVTPKAQTGNDKPRAFRLVEDNALINRMGFNNLGVDKIVQNIKKSRSNIIIGGNIGKNKVTPNDIAVSDYKYAFKALYPYVDYFTINVSSPNTPNLRDLQDKKPLKTILISLKEYSLQMETVKPILLKIAPDLSFSQIDEIIEIVQECNIDGIVATNTTISRENLRTDAEKISRIGNGGLSGKPLKTTATEIIRYISEQTQGKMPIIGVGGIMSPDDAIEKIKAGASLIQLYTGFIYEGPGLVKKINKTLLKMYKNEYKNQRN